MTEYRLHGPPGTGKTRALSMNWVPRAAEKFGSDRVVICSLTKTAATEIASRGLPIPDKNVGTLHALAYRALGRPEIAESRISEWNEAEPLFALSGGAATVEEPEMRSERGSLGDRLSGVCQVMRHNRIPRDRWPHDAQLFQRAWEVWLEGEGMTDFTGLIEDALESVPMALGDPAVFIVDEAQDCSVLELDLVRKWTQKAEYSVLAGDGDQAIYGWRGASARAFLGEGIPTEGNYHLTQSYRVPREVHAFASRWIRQAGYRYAVDYDPRPEDGRLVRSAGSSRAVEPLLREIEEDTGNGQTVMALAGCGFMLRHLIQAMRREGVPFHNPYRKAHGGWNPLRGGAGRLVAFLRPDPRVYDSPSLWTFSELLTWLEIMRSGGHLLRGAKSKARIRATQEPDRVATPKEIEEIIGIPAWQSLRAAFEGDHALAWLRERILGSKATLMEYPFTVAERRGAKALIDEPKICVGTMHSTKGGEADSVYLFPDLSSSGMREWTGSGDGRDGIIRTFYVGATRARRKLVLANRSSNTAVEWMA